MKQKLIWMVLYCLCAAQVCGISKIYAAEDAESVIESEKIEKTEQEGTEVKLELEKDPLLGFEVQSKSIPFAGSGTQEDPYYINSEEDLRMLAELVNAGETFASQYLYLTADITLTQLWTPIGLSQNGKVIAPFQGNFDGGKHTIYQLQGPEEVSDFGLFGCVQGGAVHDLAVTGRISAVSYTGGVISYAEEAQVYACRSEAEIRASGQFAGGIVGYFKNSFMESNCNKGDIAGTGSGVGGLAGGIQESIIRSCYNLGNITGNDYTAGIVGMACDTSVMRLSTIDSCYSCGEIVAQKVPSRGSAIADGLLTAQMDNNYYLMGSAVSGAFGTNAPGKIAPMTQEEMQNPGFAEMLSSSYVYLPEMNHGYPELKVFASWNSPQDVVIEELPSAGEITYGQALSASTLSGGKVTGASGVWSWEDPDFYPCAGTDFYTVIFTPDSETLKSISAEVTLTVHKATPVLEEVEAADITYGQTLQLSEIRGTVRAPF